MDATRIHLLITHLPVFGLSLGVFAFIYGIIRQDKHVKIVSTLIVIIAAVGGIIAFQTGGAAEERVEDIAGVVERVIEEHEESAELVVVFYYILVGVSLVALFFEARESDVAKVFSYVLLICIVITFGFTTHTASLGGKIRHTEIAGTPTGAETPNASRGEQHEEDED